jgi:hypothetical protein
MIGGFDNGGSVRMRTVGYMLGVLISMTSANAQTKTDSPSFSTCQWNGNAFSIGATFCIFPKTAISCEYDANGHYLKWVPAKNASCDRTSAAMPGPH